VKSHFSLNQANSLIPKQKLFSKSEFIGSEIELTIDSVAHGGNGVGRYKDLVVFVPWTAPGDHVLARITSYKKNFAEAELIKLITPSKFRIEPPCPVYGVCGGCQWQHVNYEEQLKQKEFIVAHALSRIAKEEGASILPIIRSPLDFFYRNRVTFQRDGSKIGFYQKQSHKIVNVEKCYIADEIINEKLKNLRQDSRSLPLSDRFEVSVDETSGFSQVNSRQNVNMQKYVLKALENPDAGQKLLDLYCGSGNFSFPIADLGWDVYGVDLNKAGIEAAVATAASTRRKIYFKKRDCAAEARDLAMQNKNFDAILLDPPRTGADETLWDSIKILSPKKLIYVSCNPATFARDWARLRAKTSLKLISVQPFDMFPQTFHVELIALAHCF
jgi:23S rRNA (uracil1939-C5)-methyltransferase